MIWLHLLGGAGVAGAVLVVALPLLRERRYRHPRCPECDARLQSPGVAWCRACEKEITPRVSRAWGGRQPVRTAIAGVLLLAGATLLLAPRVIADGLWAIAPDRVLVGAMDRITDPQDHRVKLLSRRLGAGSVEAGPRLALARRCATRLERSDDPEDWRFVAVLLSGMPIEEPSLIDALARGLASPDPSIREQAAYALARAPEDDAVPALTGATTDAAPSVRAMAAWALWRHAADGELDADATRALDPLLDDPAPNVRYQAAEALALVVDDPAQLLDQLIEGLASTDPFTRARAAGAIGRLGPDASRALPALENACLDPEPAVGAAAADAIGRITAHAAVPDGND